MCSSNAFVQSFMLSLHNILLQYNLHKTKIMPYPFLNGANIALSQSDGLNNLEERITDLLYVVFFKLSFLLIAF